MVSFSPTRRGSVMVLTVLFDRALLISYKLSVVTNNHAEVLPQFATQLFGEYTESYCYIASYVNK